MKLSKFCNKSFAAVCRESTLVESMKALVNYAEAFHLGYEVKFVHMRIKYIVEDTMWSDYLLARMRVTDVGNIQLATLCIDESSLLFSLERLSAEGGTGKSSGMSHVHCSNLNSTGHDQLELMVGATDYFIKINPKCSLVHSLSFHAAPKSTLAERCKMYTGFSTKVQPSFSYFMSGKVQAQTDSSQNVKQWLLFKTMRLLQSDSMDKNRRWVGMSETLR